jgi:hypothetical protein
MANTSINRSRIRGGLNKYDNILVGNTKFADTVEVSGGLLSSDSTYYYRTFKSSGSLVVTGGAVNADVLVVAGGGGGGYNIGGGGGAGGLLSFASQTISPGTFAVTVGAGGAGGTSGTSVGAVGTSSQFASLTSTVGGGFGGGPYNNNNAGSGGSGGGGPAKSGGNSAGGSGTSGQGNAGGQGTSNGTNWAGGGGGGAAAVGSNGSNGGGAAAIGGNGGNGNSTFSTWGLATGTGQNSSGTVYFAGGGAGPGFSGTPETPGTGGLGGGGTATTGVGGSGTANTGGGGAGGFYTNNGGAGGSGIVIVRYLKSAVLPTQTDFELIGTITLSAAQSSVTFTGLPTDYKHLQLRIAYRGAANLAGDNPQIQFNSDTTYTNYYTHWLYGNGSGVTAFGTQSTNYRGIAIAQNMPDAGSTANIFGGIVVDILDAFSSSKNKTTRSLFGGTGYSMIGLGSGVWLSTSAISSITLAAYPGNLTNSIAANTRISIYGARG